MMTNNLLQQICNYMIIYRLAQGCAWNRYTPEKITALEFRSSNAAKYATPYSPPSSKSVITRPSLSNDDLANIEKGHIVGLNICRTPVNWLWAADSRK